jgi:D-alanine-D-alanine ligase
VTLRDAEPGSAGASGRRRRVALVFGGRSAEHEISVVSARSVFEALDPARYDVLVVGIDKRGRWRRLAALPAPRAGGALPAVDEDEGVGVALARDPDAGGMVADDGTEEAVDVVFPVLHGPYGEDGAIQGLLELAGIPYVGSGVLGSAVGLDKAVQKVLFAAVGLPIVRYEVILEPEWETDREGSLRRAEALGLPVFVKPATLGSSVGITKVKRAEDLPAAFEDALSYARKVVVERSVERAREIECAVLGNDDPEASVAGEILPAGEWYDYRSKYLDDGTGLEIPAHLPPEVAAEVRRMSVAAFRAIDGAGMARVDFFYRPPAELVVNEVNTIPGFTSVSMYPKLWEASGVPYPELIDRLIELAIERHHLERKRGRALEDGPT